MYLDVDVGVLPLGSGWVFDTLEISKLPGQSREGREDRFQPCRQVRQWVCGWERVEEPGNLARRAESLQQREDSL